MRFDGLLTHGIRRQAFGLLSVECTFLTGVLSASFCVLAPVSADCCLTTPQRTVTAESPGVLDDFYDLHYAQDAAIPASIPQSVLLHQYQLCSFYN